MLLPLVLALVTAMALVLVIGPLMRAGAGISDRLEFDRAVYRDQLRELERDRTRGLIGDAEAQTAKLEIERRMLAADRADRATTRANVPLPRLAAVVAIAVAAGAAAIYVWIGQPGVPDEPLASRATPPGASDAAMSANLDELQKRVAAKPDDIDAWLTLGRTEADLKDWDKAADAYGHAAALSPARADIGESYGETLVFAEDGIVAQKAQDEFRAVLKLQPKDGVARYYLALADAQAGRTDAAIAAWQGLAAEAPDGAPIRDEVKDRIAAAAKQAGIPVPALAPPAAPESASAPPASASAQSSATADASAATAPGPTPEQMQDAAKMTPDQRQAMIKGMVQNLADQLKAQPNDLAGWTRLARAYGVLGERDKAADAFEHASALDPKDVSLPLGEVDALLDGAALDQPIPDRVVALLKKVEATSPNEPEALWYLGLAAAQTKNTDQAASYWKRLLAQLPADAPERKTVSEALASLGQK